MGSKSFALDVGDIASLLKNALLVAVSAFLTVLVNNLASLDLGQYTPMIVPMIAVILNTAIQWVRDNSKEVEEVKAPPVE